MAEPVEDYLDELGAEAGKDYSKYYSVHLLYAPFFTFALLTIEE
jgi:hypothetical protein